MRQLIQMGYVTVSLQKVEQDTLFEIILAANYLDIKVAYIIQEPEHHSPSISKSLSALHYPSIFSCLSNLNYFNHSSCRASRSSAARNLPTGSKVSYHYSVKIYLLKPQSKYLLIAEFKSSSKYFLFYLHHDILGQRQVLRRAQGNV